MKKPHDNQKHTWIGVPLAIGVLYAIVQIAKLVTNAQL